jgi:tRNA modification GTPase
MFTLDDTIAAVASAPAGADRGIVRLSGPCVIDILSQCFQASDPALGWKCLTDATVIPGCMTCQRFRSADLPERWLELPADVFLWPTAKSFTRQPVAEIHTIGSPPLLQSILQTLCCAGARLAQPGEFTLRAFLAGRIDLTQAEAVLGVIDATDRRQLHAALDQLAGGLSHPLQRLRSDLLNLLADLEAGLDFVEDDIRFVSTGELQNRLTEAAAQLEKIARQLTHRDTGANLPRVVLVGWPNVGKSSLFNALVGTAAALVSHHAGTTRDYLTATLDAAGLSVELIDTAGLETDGESRKAEDTAAQAAATVQHRQADLRIFCLDAARPLNDWELNQLGSIESIGATLVVLTKCDQPAQCDLGISAIRTSRNTGLGLNYLREAIRRTLTAQPVDASVVATTADRVRESIRTARESLLRAGQLVAPQVNQPAEELVAAELRTALAELGKVVGAIYTDDLLDRIFSRFCIGK